ncbi:MULTISPECIES: arylamine N-acetyltransferase [unclassified Streptomyces]|uniref:arylamine N-acetyltransferase family protein n=1 Tax=unclassified Streptomyces TaxID=2593676 RepID=UPI001BE98AF2|nr:MULTISPECIES: arylamine N-acetyltransferase [unclassified Streptomyces]MBT2403408.1 arylamine N-acetyltransferase [Streptomyces sp. ISL-21]MBT2606939.1 arylamine N-acetyltransferase [Streptomyces sp. ISL-87]
MTTGIFAGYLRRLGITEPDAPSAEGLFALQRAHLERVPYENLDIQLGRPPGIDPEVSVRRLAAGRGGYCYHLNGAFALLLGALGYEVTRHVGGVHSAAERDRRDVNGDHLALTVRVGGQAYFVDAGLGDGPHEPLPLRAGTYPRGGSTYRMEELAGAEPGWTYINDDGSAPVMNFHSAPAGPAAEAVFAREHSRMSTAEDSGFVRTFAVMRRDAEGIDVLRGRVLSRIDPVKGTGERELATPGEFFEVLEGVFGRRLDDVTPADRAALWARVGRAHEAWLASRTD